MNRGEKSMNEKRMRRRPTDIRGPKNEVMDLEQRFGMMKPVAPGEAWAWADCGVVYPHEKS